MFRFDTSDADDTDDLLHRQNSSGPHPFPSRTNSMRGITPGKCVIWALLLSWPWILRYAALNSPQMIVKGTAESTSVLMPLIADLILIAGGTFAVQARKRQLNQPQPPRHEITRPSPHFALQASRAEAKKRANSRVES